MKRITKIILALLVCMPVMAMSQAEYSRYYIEGDYSMRQGKNGSMYYTLTNIATRGITLGLGNTNMIYGNVGEDESVMFTFDSIENRCPDKYSHILFWKAKEGDGPVKWQIDSEVRKAKSEKRTDMVKIILLVLDCSNSLGNDFNGLKKSAKEFVDILAKSAGNGNIRIGVIGFSNVANTDTNVIPIQELNSKSKGNIKKAIDGLTQHNNTAMYYAMDKGQKMITEYFGALDLADDQKFGGAIMVTFTDGFDNHSLMNGRVFKKGLQNPYFIYVRDTTIRQTYTYTHKDVLQSDGSRRDVVESYPLESMMLVLKGNDVSEDDRTYINVFNALATDKPYYVKNFGEVKKKFNEIAELIVSRFEVLKCYVPRAHEGRVRWTFDKPHGFFGFSAGAFGEGTSAMRFGAGANLGIDFGFPTKDFRAWGGFVDVKPEYSFTTTDFSLVHAQAGVLYVGRHFQYQKAPLLGVGLDLRVSNDYYYSSTGKYRYWDDIGFGLVLRGGIISQKHFYWYADLALGYFNREKSEKTGTSGYGYSNYSHVDDAACIYYMLGFNIGFRF